MTEKNAREKVDLRGLSCPLPVIRTKKLLDNPSIDCVEALVDDQVNVQNLTRLARSLKASITVENKDNGYSVEISRSSPSETSTTPSAHEIKPPSHTRPTEDTTIVLISKDRLGDGDPAFSNNLLNLFLQTMFELGHRPQAILMLNSGVKIMSENSPFEKVLKDFKDDGVEVLACGLCVEFYGLKEFIAKEQITNMFAICEYISAATKVITP